MTNHPITPPPELVQEWWDDTHGAFYEFEAITIQAARWGADQELEACRDKVNLWSGDGDRLYAARRPKLSNLKEQAMAVIENAAICDHLSSQDESILRQALGQLDD